MPGPEPLGERDHAGVGAAQGHEAEFASLACPWVMTDEVSRPRRSLVRPHRHNLLSLLTEEERRTGTGFNFGTPRVAGVDLRHVELHGLSAFALEHGVVYHAYSCYDRGTDVLNGTWQLLDRTPKGRDADVGGWPHRRADEEPAAAAATRL